MYSLNVQVSETTMDTPYHLVFGQAAQGSPVPGVGSHVFHKEQLNQLNSNIPAEPHVYYAHPPVMPAEQEMPRMEPAMSAEEEMPQMEPAMSAEEEMPQMEPAMSAEPKMPQMEPAMPAEQEIPQMEPACQLNRKWSRHSNQLVFVYCNDPFHSLQTYYLVCVFSGMTSSFTITGPGSGAT